jgi:tetratricopeptide (TPR) repeat protein
MKKALTQVVVVLAVFGAWVVAPLHASAEVRAWEGTITIPTYPWEEDVNPKFWALEGGSKLSTTIRGAIYYPYVAQDHLSRTKVDRTYKALFLENEYLKVTCLPALGGRLHSVLDKTQNKEMFHLSRVIKPGMIAMRGAWISGGVEWNTGPHGHTITAVSPVNALAGKDNDGSAYLEISNTEQIFRTRWTVRVTLHPGKKYLDERIRIANPTDGMHPYYFWNCTAFPNLPGTRFIYPMTLGTDHNAREFFRWPVDKGRDLTWLKNYETYASVFSVNCTYDFFGAYDVNLDRGIVQVANHNELGGKKAWTWGEWEFGKVAQKNLTDEDGPYIEVQSGPLPTQSDYGMLGPHEEVSWQEYWYPVHGLGDGFEYANKDVAVQRAVRNGRLELRILATAPSTAICQLSRGGQELLRKLINLSPETPATVVLAQEPEKPVDVRIESVVDMFDVLAQFTTPLPIPKVEPPDLAKFKEKPDNQMTVEESYFKGRKLDRETNRRGAREYYEKALGRDPHHVASLRSLAVLDFEAGLYKNAIARLDKALDRDSDDGLSWYYRGVCHLRLAASTPLPPEPAKAKEKPDDQMEELYLYRDRKRGREASLRGNLREAQRCGYRAVRCPGTVSLGYGLIARAAKRMADDDVAEDALKKSIPLWARNQREQDTLLEALIGHYPGKHIPATATMKAELHPYPTSIVPRAYYGFESPASLAKFSHEVRAFLGDCDFELLETSLLFAEMGFFDEAGRIAQAACDERLPPDQRSFMPLYYLAWYAWQSGDPAAARKWLQQAAVTHKDRVFASRPEEVEILQFAIQENPGDAQAHLQLGCLLANLGRVDEAVPEWKKAAELYEEGRGKRGEGRGEKGEGRRAIGSISWRNLGLAAAAKNDAAGAEGCYRKAMAARPSDQTLFRDLAEILIAQGKRPDAIRLLETMPMAGMRRAEIIVMLAQAYVDEKRWDDCVKHLESTPYFVNWEGQDVTWRLFNRAHIERGRQRLDKGDAKAALTDFEAALTYPANLNVGRSNKPEEAPAQYWRGKALATLGRTADARTAWQTGAAGADVAGAQNEYRQKCREALAGGTK